MKKRIVKAVLKYGPVIFLLLFSSLEFFLILQHKSCYISDSYFYKHIFYTLKGDNFNQAYQKVLSQIDRSRLDEISRNFYFNIAAYKDTLRFFTKRPLYPFLTFLINFMVKNEFISFLLPIFAAFFGCVYLATWFSKKGHNKFWATLTSALFISFYPFLDWSTYFMTDTIGAFFWFLQIAFIFNYLEVKNLKWLLSFIVVLIISLFNREQSLLIVLFFVSLFWLLKKFRFPNGFQRRVKLGFLISLLIALVYVFIAQATSQKTLYDTIVYTQNSYGLESRLFTRSEVTKYWLNSIIRSHVEFIRDLVSHHWWFAHAVFGLLGIIKLLFFTKKPLLADLIIFSSGTASYLAIYFYPVLSYRYFIPAVFTICYFSVKFIFFLFAAMERDK